MKRFNNSLYNILYHRFILLAILFIFFLKLYAQPENPCPAGNLSEYPGAWKPFSGYQTVAQFKAKAGSYDKTAADATLEKMLALARQAYPQPQGGNANYTKYLDFSNAYDYMPFGYRLYIGHPGFVCTLGDKITESVETGVYLVFHVNSYQSVASSVSAPEVPGTNRRLGVMKGSESDYSINGRRVFHIHEHFVGSNGWMDHYTEKIYAGEEPRQQWYIVRKENVPLFSYVTRREYLSQFREEIKIYREEHIRHVNEEYRKYPEFFKQEFEWLGEFIERAENAIRLVDNYLMNEGEEELQKPVSELLNHGYFIYTDEPEIKFREDRFHLVYYNDEYLDEKLPHHIPQFIVVELSGPAYDKTGRDAWKYNFRKKMMEGLDFEAMHKILLR